MSGPQEAAPPPAPEATGDGAPPGRGACLPIDAGAVRVDESGFHGAVEIPWADVAGVHAGGGVLEVQRTRDGAPGVVALRARIDPRQGGAIEAAWRQRVIDALRAGKPFTGVLLKSHAAAAPFVWLLGIMMLGWAAGIVALTAAWADLAAASAGAVAGGAVAAGWLAAAVALLLAGGLFVAARRHGRMARAWRRWEYDAEGLHYWPDGPSARRVVLRPLAADFVSPDVAVIARQRVPLEWMTGYGLVAKLLMVTGRRSEATIARDSYVELVVVPLLCAVLWASALVTHLAAPGKALILGVVFGTACVTTIAWMWDLSASRRRFRAFFLEGRAMLERLGW